MFGLLDLWFFSEEKAARGAVGGAVFVFVREIPPCVASMVPLKSEAFGAIPHLVY